MKEPSRAWVPARLRGRFQYKWIALSVTTLGALMAAIDSTIVILGLPSMMSELHAGLIEMVWVIIGYLLVSTVFLLTFGRIADMLGRPVQNLDALQAGAYTLKIELLDAAGKDVLGTLAEILEKARFEGAAALGLSEQEKARRLSEALLHRAGWLGHARSEKIFEGLHEHLARLASTMLLEDQHPMALVLTGGCDVFRVVADREALRACGLRPRTLSRLEPLIMALVTKTLLTSSPASGRVH